MKLAVAALLAAAVAGGCRSGPSLSAETSYDKRGYASAKLAELLRWYRADVGNLTTDQLSSLTNGSDKYLAVAAAWELVRRTVPVAWHPGVNSPPDKRALAKFVSLIEKIGPAPKRWKSAVLLCLSAGRDNFEFPFFDDVYDEKPQATIGLAHPFYEVKISGGHQWQIPNPEKEGGFDSAAGVEVDNDVFLATYDNDPPRPFTLCHLNRTTKQVTWQSDVWADDGFIAPGGSGTDPSRVWLSTDQRDLFVFGISGGLAYLEVFDLQNGENVFRFCTKDFDPPLDLDFAVGR